MNTFLYKSEVPLTTHVIEHNLNDYPTVAIYVRNQETGIYELRIAQNVELISFNTCTVTFNNPHNCVVKFVA